MIKPSNQKSLFGSKLLRLCLLMLLVLSLSQPLWAQDNQEEVDISVSEQIGKKIPLNLTFKSSNGDLLQLADIIDRPTIILPAFLYCSQSCGLQMAYLASAIRQLGKDNWDSFRMVTLSFDAEDTPELAANSKKNYVPLIDHDFKAENWRFLTGQQKEIDTFLNAIGYRVKKTEPRNFLHPNAVMVVAEDGTIIRYLYGPKFLTFDIGMALEEARKGTPGISIKRVLSYCFDYDHTTQRYVFQSFRVIGIVIVLVLFSFYWFFLRKGNQHHCRSFN